MMLHVVDPLQYQNSDGPPAVDIVTVKWDLAWVTSGENCVLRVSCSWEDRRGARVGVYLEARPHESRDFASRCRAVRKTRQGYQLSRQLEFLKVSCWLLLCFLVLL